MTPGEKKEKSTSYTYFETLFVTYSLFCSCEQGAFPVPVFLGLPWLSPGLVSFPPFVMCIYVAGEKKLLHHLATPTDKLKLACLPPEHFFGTSDECSNFYSCGGYAFKAGGSETNASHMRRLFDCYIEKKVRPNEDTHTY